MDDDNESDRQVWPAARTWQKLGARQILPQGEDLQVRELLAASLPPSMRSAAVRRDVELALIDAVARKQRPGASLKVVVASLADGQGVAPDCDCWSFFVIERPGGSGEPGEVIELCLYRE